MTHRSVRVTSLLLAKNGVFFFLRTTTAKNLWTTSYGWITAPNRGTAPLHQSEILFFLWFHVFTEASDSPKKKRREVKKKKKEKQQQENKGKSRRPCRSQFCALLPLPEPLLGVGVRRVSRTAVCHWRVVSGETERRREIAGKRP